MHSEDDLLPLSALQHLRFCERQCALIHVEGLWAENRLTVEGSHLHRKVHEGPDEARGDVRTVRGMPLRSLHLGLVGQADAVEFHRRKGEPGEPPGVHLEGAPGEWLPFPVEYKRGRPKRDGSDELQLCAQALCLEEMLSVPVPRGALFYGETRRRQDVEIGAELRADTEATAARLHELIASGTTPKAVREPKCESCSLLHLCLPEALRPGRSAAGYLARALSSLDPLPSPGSRP